MENQNEALANLEANPATIPVAVAPKVKVEPYHKRLRKMSNRALLAETKRVRTKENKKLNYHGITLATVLEAVLSSHIKTVSRYR